MPGRGFIIFWIFLILFSEFSCRVEYKRNSGLKFFSRFLGPPHPVLAKNYVGKGFFNFLNFFSIFFRIFLPGPSMNGIRDYNFFPSFLACLVKFWEKRMQGRGFIIFRIFFKNFFGIFLPRSSMNGIRD